LINPPAYITIGQRYKVARTEKALVTISQGPVFY